MQDVMPIFKKKVGAIYHLSHCWISTLYVFYFKLFESIYFLFSTVKVRFMSLKPNNSRQKCAIIAQVQDRSAIIGWGKKNVPWGLEALSATLREGFQPPRKCPFQQAMQKNKKGRPPSPKNQLNLHCLCTNNWLRSKGTQFPCYCKKERKNAIA